MSKDLRTFISIVVLTILALVVALPSQIAIPRPYQEPVVYQGPQPGSRLFGIPLPLGRELKKGLDIQGGMQVVLQADMSEIAEIDRDTALEAAREILLRRVDLYGVSEPSVQTARVGDEYRIVIELPGVTNPAEALQLVGQTAELSFQLLDQETLVELEAAQQELLVQGPSPEPPATTAAALAELPNPLVEVGLTGSLLRRSTVQFDPTSGEPIVAIEFDPEGTERFAEITREHVGEPLAIVLDNQVLMTPVINTEIPTGQATITGGFTLEQAEALSIQLNAGALPVPISVLEQRTVGASLGAASVTAGVTAGAVGLALVVLFMILVYGVRGLLASVGLVIFAILTVAVYKLIGVTLTLPGIAGLLLSIGMAVDANILIFERMKEELRLGKPFEVALELGFGRAWDSIKDANVATILTALILINPFNVSFLSTSGLVRGFGTTLLVGVVLSLFTGVVVSRNLLRLFLHNPERGTS